MTEIIILSALLISFNIYMILKKENIMLYSIKLTMIIFFFPGIQLLLIIIGYLTGCLIREPVGLIGQLLSWVIIISVAIAELINAVRKKESRIPKKLNNIVLILQSVSANMKAFPIGIVIGIVNEKAFLLFIITAAISIIITLLGARPINKQNFNIKPYRIILSALIIILCILNIITRELIQY